MKISKITEIVLVVMMLVAIVLLSTNVFAADDGFTTLVLNSVSNTANTTTTNTANTVTTTNTSTNKVTNNTALPSTGLADSTTTVLLILVFGISAVYAYKKVSDYKKI